VEGTVKKKDLTTPKGTAALKVGDTADFVVTEFQRDAKRIVLSHTRTWKEASAEEQAQEGIAAEKKATSSTGSSSKPKAVKLPPVEKSTLGDIEGLAALKANLEAEEKGVAKTKAAKITKTKVETEEAAPAEVTASVEEVLPTEEAAPAEDAGEAPKAE
jgi:small subunit ribosomal protein S1